MTSEEQDSLLKFDRPTSRRLRESPLPDQRISAAHLRRRRCARWLSLARAGENDRRRCSLFRRSKFQRGPAQCHRVRTGHEQFHLSEAVAIGFRRTSPRYRFQHYEHRRRSSSLSYLVQPFRRHSREIELWNSARDHDALARAVAALETRTTRWRLRFFAL